MNWTHFVIERCEKHIPGAEAFQTNCESRSRDREFVMLSAP